MAQTLGVTQYRASTSAQYAGLGSVRASWTPVTLPAPALVRYPVEEAPLGLGPFPVGASSADAGLAGWTNGAAGDSRRHRAVVCTADPGLAMAGGAAGGRCGSGSVGRVDRHGTAVSTTPLSRRRPQHVSRLDRMKGDCQLCYFHRLLLLQLADLTEKKI